MRNRDVSEDSLELVGAIHFDGRSTISVHGARYRVSSGCVLSFVYELRVAGAVLRTGIRHLRVPGDHDVCLNVELQFLPRSDGLIRQCLPQELAVRLCVRRRGFLLAGVCM